MQTPYNFILCAASNNSSNRREIGETSWSQVTPENPRKRGRVGIEHNVAYIPTPRQVSR